jgi:hypothetical protein
LNPPAVLLAICVVLLGSADSRAQTAEQERKPAAPLASLPAPKMGGPLRILLVDDNASPNNIAGNTHRNPGSDDVFRDLVAAVVGGDAKAWSLEVARYQKDGPSLERLRDFNVVVWYTGDSYGGGADTLSKQDEVTVRRYLQETGGAFVLISPGYVNNLVYGTTWQNTDYPFLTEVMGVNGAAPLAQRFAAGRVSSSSGGEFPVAHPGAAETQFSAVNSNGAAIVFTATLDPGRTSEGPVPVGVANSFGAGRFVYVGFTFENIPAADRGRAFEQLLSAATGGAVVSARPARATLATAPTLTPAPTLTAPGVAAPAVVAQSAATTATPVAVAPGGAQINQPLLLAPVAIKPTPGVTITGPAVRFQWQYEPDPAHSVRYEVCVSEAGLPCSAPTAAVFKLTGTPMREVTLENRTAPGPAGGPALGTPTNPPKPPYFYSATLPYSLQGKRLQWSVTACTTNQSQANIAGRSSERCAASSPNSMTWALPAPTLVTPADNSIVATVNRRSLTPPVFTWRYGDAQGVDFFLLCLGKPGVACPSKAVVQREVLAVDALGSLSTTLTQDLTPFMGQTLSWTVAACNSVLGCSYQQSPGRLLVPILDGTFDAIYHVTQNDKCLNCHEMHRDNAIYQRHVALGRFTREEIPSSSIGGLNFQGHAKCRSCHTAATGFLDHWRAPGNSGIHVRRRPMSRTFCRELQEDSVMTVRGIAHLRSSSDILWAVERIPDLGTARWLELVNTWNRQCPCDGHTRTNCSLRGQFIP